MWAEKKAGKQAVMLAGIEKADRQAGSNVGTGTTEGGGVMQPGM